MSSTFGHKMKVLISSVLVLSLVYSSLGAKLPSILKKCKRDDSACLTSTIQAFAPLMTKNYKEIGVPSFNPFHLPSLVIGEGKGPVAVIQDFKNVEVFGVPEAKLHSAKFDWDEKVLQMNLTIPLRLEGDYVLDGRILLLPIRGKGKSVINIEDAAVDLRFPFEIETKKGEEYLKFFGAKAVLNPAKLTFKFGNLFDGDAALSDNLHKVLNENWNEVYQDVRTGYEEVVAKVIESTANAVFSRIPANEIFEK